MGRKYWVVTFVFILIGWSFLTNGISNAPAQEKQRTFVGVSMCQTCHNGKVAEKDAATPSSAIWKDSSHAKAYESLASDQAKAAAKEKGIADPQKAPECLACHVTAYGIDAQYLGKKYRAEDGVQCESCHGAGGDYASNIKVKNAIKKGEADPATVGLIVKPDEKTCVQCHNDKSPTFKGFNFAEKVKVIAHPILK